jgi:hypothetical protein
MQFIYVSKVAVRNLLTLPVIFARGDRRFSTLKPNKLKSTMADKRLIQRPELSIGNCIVRQPDLSADVQCFVQARKVGKSHSFE